MRRRDFLALLGAAAVSAPAHAQRRPRLGYLSGGLQGDPNSANTIEVLKASLAELGLRAGETIEIGERWADGDAARLPRLARELLDLRPDILASTGATETRALHAITKTVPIVFLQLATDPVGQGLVERIARPGGNVTGFMQAPQPLWSKRIGFLAELLGRPPRRLAWLCNPGNASTEASWVDAKDAAARAGSAIVRVDVNIPADIDRAFDSMKDRDGLLVQFDFLTATEKDKVAALAARGRLPAIYENRSQALAGGLMSYGGDLRENFRQGAAYIERILKGARPAELPVIQASRFELVVNLGAARALGIAVPSALLSQADEVIE
ncbi:MAG: ABC transporter substrate-binding protein [Alphaproteobacteria bacterium]|nr:ABC transporter substrate-binding protein [Alphaproteobacteria bacterium]